MNLRRHTVRLPSRYLVALVALVSAIVPRLAIATPPIPQEVLDACAGKTKGAPCTVTFQGKEFHGVCGALGDGKLACRPKR